MNIIEIPSFFPPYGGEFCLEQSKALVNQGHNVEVLACIQLSIKRSLHDYLFAHTGERAIQMMGVNVRRREIRGTPRCIKQNVTRWTNNVLQMFRRYVRKKGKPDIVHAHCAKWAGYAAYLIYKEYGIPYVITEHLSSMVYKDEFGETGEGCWQIPLLRQALLKASMVVPVAEELVEDVSRYFGLDYRWQAISNIIETNFFSFYDRSNHVHNVFKYCCIANYIPLKGYDVLFNAFRIIQRKYPSCQLHIAGVGTDGQECKMAIGNNCNIVAHGCLDKDGVRQLLHECDCLVLASRSEAQPLVLLEAMSTGLPVISTSAVPKIERIKGGCFVVDVDDIEGLAESMEQVMNIHEFDGKTISQKVADIASPRVVGGQLSHLFSSLIVNKN